MYGAASTPEQRLRNAQFLHDEIGVRVAQRIEDLRALAYGLAEEPTTLQLVEW